MGRFSLQEQDIDTLVDSLPYVDTVMIAGRGEPCFSVCQGCTDDHRRFRRESLRDTRDELRPRPLRLAVRLSRFLSRALGGRGRIFSG